VTSRAQFADPFDCRELGTHSQLSHSRVTQTGHIRYPPRGV